ncbi:MAG: hypothetical protein QM487_10850 [Candidatus Marithrix sp.]
MNYEENALREKYKDFPCMPLSEYFAGISSGEIQSPRREIFPNKMFISQGDDLVKYSNVYKRNMAAFWKHYCASIPFLFEEQCRVGLALLRMAQSLSEKKYLTFYETDSQDGTDARTLAELANGKIITLTNGLHDVTKKNFEKLCKHTFSHFYLGYFCDVTPELINSSPELYQFKDGCDIVYENATFQFYDKNRVEQIAHIRKIMKNDGIFICLEKLSQRDIQEYENRERVKDEKYKSFYFSEEEVKWKQSKILIDMKFQVDYETLISALKGHFKFVYLLWNSTNFYEIAASNSRDNIQKFLSLLVSPHLPVEFNFEGDLSQPRKL